MSVVIGSSGTLSEAIGSGDQTHLIFDGTCYWIFYPSSAQSAKICYRYSTDFTTWSSEVAVTATQFPLLGRRIAVAFRQSQMTVLVFWFDDFNNKIMYRRGVISGTTITWAAEVWFDGGSAATLGDSIRAVLDTNNQVWVTLVKTSGYNNTYLSASALTTTFADTNIISPGTAGAQTTRAYKIGIAPLASGNMILVADDSSGATIKVYWYLWNGSTWASQGDLWADTGADHLLWCVKPISLTSIGLLGVSAASTLSFSIHNGTTFVSKTAPTWPTSGIATLGLSLHTDGTDYYAYVIRGDANNSLSTNKYSVAGNSWSGWSDIDATSHVRTQIQAGPGSSSALEMIYAQTNGSNFDIVGQKVSLFSGTSLPRSDNFNRSGATLGTPSDAGTAWIAINGTWGTNGSVASCSAGTGVCLAALDSGATDVEVSVQISHEAASYYGDGVILRCDGTNQNYVKAVLSAQLGAIISYVASGAPTSVDNLTVTLVDGDTIKLTAVGNVFNVYQNGILILGPYTLPGLVAGTWIGIAANTSNSTSTFDNFLATIPGGGPKTVTGAGVTASGSVGNVTIGSTSSGGGAGDAVISVFYPIALGSTTSPLLFRMMDANFPTQGKTGLSPVVSIRKAGGSWITPTGAVSELPSPSGGWYQVAANANDTNTAGPLLIVPSATGAIGASYLYWIGTAPANITQINGAAATLDTDKTGYSLAATGLDAIRTTLVAGPATSFADRLNQTWSRFYCRSVKDSVAHTEKFYDVDSTTVLNTQNWTDDGSGNQTISKGA